MFVKFDIFVVSDKELFGLGVLVCWCVLLFGLGKGGVVLVVVLLIKLMVGGFFVLICCSQKIGNMVVVIVLGFQLVVYLFVVGGGVM